MQDKVINLIKDIESKWGNKWTFLEDLETFNFKDVHDKIKIKCNDCGYVYENGKRINDLLNNYGCCGCSNLTRRTVKQMEEYILYLSDGEYELISNHNKTRDKATFKHNSNLCVNPDSNKEFDMKIHNFITNNQRCPFCSRSVKGKNNNSKGTLEIKKFLINNGIDFIQEACFNECKSPISNILLPFDFYLEDKNILIEFDGRQHFEPVEIFEGEKGFERTKRNDKIKNEFAREKGIKLIRISYKEFKDIKNILKEELNIL